jgi:hypothetical protein
MYRIVLKTPSAITHLDGPKQVSVRSYTPTGLFPCDHRKRLLIKQQTGILHGYLRDTNQLSVVLWKFAFQIVITFPFFHHPSSLEVRTNELGSILHMRCMTSIAIHVWNRLLSEWIYNMHAQIRSEEVEELRWMERAVAHILNSFLQLIAIKCAAVRSLQSRKIMSAMTVQIEHRWRTRW